ncbi:MAG: nuclear transport factor 2 family protein [Candidatus Binatia bacterium]
MDVEELLAREEIRHLLASYNVAGDRGRREEFGSVFSEDAVLEMPSGRCEGRAAILERLFAPREAASGRADVRMLTFVRHHLTTSKIDFTSPTEAKGRTYFMVLTDIGVDHSGIYVDEYRKRDGRWWIVRREVRIDYVAENPLFGVDLKRAAGRRRGKG